MAALLVACKEGRYAYVEAHVEPTIDPAVEHVGARRVAMLCMIVWSRPTETLGKAASLHFVWRIPMRLSSGMHCSLICSSQTSNGCVWMACHDS